MIDLGAGHYLDLVLGGWVIVATSIVVLPIFGLFRWACRG